MRSHLREIRSFLVGYGATNITTENTGKDHIKFNFSFLGKEYAHIVPSTPRDNARGVKNAIAQIRRNLGAAPKPIPKEKKSLDDLMPNISGVRDVAKDFGTMKFAFDTAQAAIVRPAVSGESDMEPEVHGEGRMAIYELKGKASGMKNAVFIIPEAVYKAVGSPSRLTFTRDTKSNDSWNLKEPAYGGFKVISYTKGFVKFEGVIMDEIKGLGSWGSSPAGYIGDPSDHNILATVDMKNLVVVKHVVRRPKGAAFAPKKVVAEPVRAPVVNTARVEAGVPSKEEIQNALDIIRRVEATLPLKLRRSETRGLILDYSDC